MIKQLKQVVIDGKPYFVDIRLNEFRAKDTFEQIKFRSEQGDLILSDLVKNGFFTDEELSELRI